MFDKPDIMPRADQRCRCDNLDGPSGEVPLCTPVPHMHGKNPQQAAQENRVLLGLRRWQRFEALPPSSITAETVPWPPDSTRMLAAMVAVDQQGRRMHPQDTGCSEAAAWRRAFRAASLHWHPDKFLSRFGASMAEADKSAVMARVHVICQSINEQWRERAVQ